MNPFHVYSEDNKDMCMKCMLLRNGSHSLSNSIDAIYDQMITEDRYPGISRSLSKIVYGLETSNNTSGNGVREILSQHRAEEFVSDYEKTCKNERYSTGQLEKMLINQLLLLVNWSCTLNNNQLVTEFMIILGYKSYAKKPRRFRQKMENELKIRRKKKDQRVRASRMKNPPKNRPKQKTKTKQENSRKAKQEEIGDKIVGNHSGQLPSVDCPLADPLTCNTDAEEYSADMHYPYANDPLTGDLSSEYDDIPNPNPLGDEIMEGNDNAETSAEKNTNSPSTISQTGLPTPVLEGPENKYVSLNELQDIPTEGSDTRNYFSSFDLGEDPPSIDLYPGIFPDIPREELEMQPLLFNEQYRQEINSDINLDYDSLINSCNITTFGI